MRQTLNERAGVLETQHAQSFLAVAIVFPILATLFVVARFWCRRKKQAPLGTDDWLILLALLFYYGQTIVEFYALFAAKFRSHLVNLDPQTLLLEYTVTGVLELMYTFVIATVRCSLCALFLRIFSVRMYKLAAVADLVFNLAWLVYSVLIICLRCSPPARTFDETVQGTCIDQTAVFVSIVMWGIACDLVTWALPIPMVWRLQMPVATRVGLSMCFCLGIVVVMIGVARVVSVYRIDYQDVSYSGTVASNWAFAESGIAIMTACGPMLRPLFDRLLPVHRVSSWLHSATKHSGTTRSTTRLRADDGFGRFGGRSGRNTAANSYGQLRDDADDAFQHHRHQQIELVPASWKGAQRMESSASGRGRGEIGTWDLDMDDSALNGRGNGGQDPERVIRMQKDITVTAA